MQRVLVANIEARIRNVVKAAGQDLYGDIQNRIRSAVASMVRLAWADLHHPNPETGPDTEEEFNYSRKMVRNQLLGIRLFLWFLFSSYVLDPEMLDRTQKAIDRTCRRLDRLKFRSPKKAAAKF